MNGPSEEVTLTRTEARRRPIAVAFLATALIAPASPAAHAEDGRASLVIPIGSGKRTAQPLPAGDKIELSLQATIETALQNALDLDVSSLTYEKAGFGFAAASGIFDPSLTATLEAVKSEAPPTSSFQSSVSRTQTANLGFGGLTAFGGEYGASWTNRRTDSPVTVAVPGYVQINPTYSSGFTLSYSQPLLRDFGKDVTKRTIVTSRIARDQAAWGFAQVVQNAVQTVENAYWDLVYALENLKSRQEALERAKDFNRITKIKIDVGALAPIEIVQTEVTIAQREQEIILAEGQIGDAQDRLKRILNVTNSAEWTRPIVPTDRPSDALFRVDAEAGIKSALERRPEVKQAVVDIESKKVSLIYNKNQLKPRLDFSGAYGYRGVGFNNTIAGNEIDYVDALYQIRSGDYPNWSVGLNFAIPIGNHVAKGNAALAATDLELARTSLALLRQNVTVEVRNFARAVDTAFRSVVAAKKSRELAERNLDAERKKFDNGMTTSFTVAQVQNDLTTARSNELLAITAYRKAIVSWQKATGEILKAKGIEIGGLPVTLEPTPPEEGAVR